MPDPGIGVMLGTAAELTHKGKTWKVSAPDQKAKDRLEKLAKRVAINEVRALKDVLDPAAYQESFSLVIESLPKYDTFQPGWLTTVFSPAQQHLFLWSLLQGEQPDIPEKLVIEMMTESPEEVAAAFAQVLPDFFHLLLEPHRKNLPPDRLATVEAALDQLRTQLVRTPTNSA